MKNQLQSRKNTLIKFNSKLIYFYFYSSPFVVSHASCPYGWSDLNLSWNNPNTTYMISKYPSMSCLMFIQVPATFKSFVTSRAVELFTAYVGFFTYNFCLYVQLLDCGSPCITLGLNVSYIINNPGILVRYSNPFKPLRLRYENHYCSTQPQH